MKRKNSLIIFLCLLLVLACQGHAAFGEKEDLVGLALKNYDKTHYRKALYYFEKAGAAGLKEESAEFIKYALKAMRALKQDFGILEKEELFFRKNKDDASMTASLTEKHRTLARKLTGEKFYFAMVEPHLKRVVALKPDDPGAYLELGDVCYAAMQYGRAVENYEKVVLLDPGNLYAYKMAGDACVAMGDFDRARRRYSELIKVNENSLLRLDPAEMEKVKKIMKVFPETYKDVARLLDEERLDEAEVILKKRLSLNPSDYIAMTHLGILYQERGDRKNALRLFKSAIKTSPDYPVSHLYLGRLYFLMRKDNDAIAELELFKKNMRLLPKMDSDTKEMYIDSLFYLADVNFTLKEYPQARTELDEILKLDPQEEGAYYDLGVYYYVYEHSRPSAYKAFSRVIELKPGTEISKKAQYAIEFMRNNPDPRFAPDFSFIDQEYRD